MTAAAAAPITAFAELTAIATGLAALCAVTVAVIGGTGLLMWIFGL
jgi:hypothetical protein